MAAEDDVIIICFIDGAFFLIVLRIPIMPRIAASKSSFFGSVTLKWNWRY